MHWACVEYDVSGGIGEEGGNEKNERAKTKHAKEIFIELKVCA